MLYSIFFPLSVITQRCECCISQWKHRWNEGLNLGLRSGHILFFIWSDAVKDPHLIKDTKSADHVVCRSTPNVCRRNSREPKGKGPVNPFLIPHQQDLMNKVSKELICVQTNGEVTPPSFYFYSIFPSPPVRYIWMVCVCHVTVNQ